MGDFLDEVMGVLAEHVLLRHIVNSCVTVTIVILFLLLIRPLMKKLPRLGMYVLWFSVVLRILCPFSIRGIYSLFPEQLEQQIARTNHSLRVEQVARQREQARRENYGGTRNQYRLDRAASQKTVKEKVRERVRDNAAVQREISAQQTVTNIQPEPKKETEPETIVIFVWAAGVLLCSAGMILSLGITRNRYKDAVCRFENVYTHPLVSGSFVSGIFSPKIYMSETLTEEEQRYILCHERVHIRRRDYLLKPFAFLTFSLLWFNPLVWLAYHCLIKDMEISCDEKAIQTFEREERKKYSYLLLSLAGGDRRALGVNPAFSAGVVKERITSVMHYKKPGVCMTMVLVAAVALCSCGIASAPVETEKNLPEKKHAETYVEQACDIDVAKDVKADGYEITYNTPVIEPTGRLMQLAQLSNADKKEVRYAKTVYEGGVWQIAETPWLDKLLDERKEKNYEIENYQYDGKGNLYITGVYMSVSQWKLWSDREKYMGEYYPRRRELLRIDEESGEITEIPLPQEYAREAVRGEPDEEPEAYHEKEIITPDILVFADGNLLILSRSGHLSGIYSGVTGERLAELENYTDNIYCVRAGDGYFAYMKYNSESGEMDIEIRGEDANPEIVNTIPTGVKFDPAAGEWMELQFAVCEDAIVMANRDGIFEAEPDGDAFTNVIRAEKDNVYYLSSDSYVILDVVGKHEDDYVVWLFNRESEAREDKLCRYTKPY